MNFGFKDNTDIYCDDPGGVQGNKIKIKKKAGVVGDKTDRFCMLQIFATKSSYRDTVYQVSSNLTASAIPSLTG